MEHEWSWKDMTTAAPFIATSFAFAFNVGYFWSIDIGWFSLFSLSEHVVFALRALPVAIGASIIFMIGLNFAQLESRFQWLGRWKQWLFGSWIFVLAAAAFVAAALGFRFALCVSFIAVAAGAIIHRYIPTPQMSFVNVLYWVSTLIVITFIAGYFSAFSWLFHSHSRSLITGPGETVLGHLILAGQRGVLIYVPEQQGRRGEGHIRLMDWKHITDVRLCPPHDSDCQKLSLIQPRNAKP